MILGIIVGDVTGHPISEVINKQILQPLKLDNTSFPTTTAIPAPAATVTWSSYIARGHTSVLPHPPLQPSVFGAAGAMISTVGDLQVWAKVFATGSLLPLPRPGCTSFLWAPFRRYRDPGSARRCQSVMGRAW